MYHNKVQKNRKYIIQYLNLPVDFREQSDLDSATFSEIFFFPLG